MSIVRSDLWPTQIQQTMNRNDVPCNGCSLCCQRDTIRLEQDELKQGYQTVPHPFIIGARMLAHKSNGECIYLEGYGCGIHDQAPALCRIADCRSIAAKYDFDAARRLHAIHAIDIRVWDQGRKLIENELNKDSR
jgi:Fe-S-cluster containining protein